jgi:hypothetical protein
VREPGLLMTQTERFLRRRQQVFEQFTPEFCMPWPFHKAADLASSELLAQAGETPAHGRKLDCSLAVLAFDRVLGGYGGSAADGPGHRACK